MIHVMRTTRPALLMAAIGLVSAAIIAYQICLMQILSIVQWYHFASMIIAIALLGFGASGTCIALLRLHLLARDESLLPCVMTACGLAMAVAVSVAQSGCIRFDSYLLFLDAAHLYRLAATCLIYFLPIFLGALAIGLAFARHVPSIKELYCANLIGSGAGAVLAVLLMRRFAAESLPGLIACLPLLAGMSLMRGVLMRLFGFLALCLAVVCTIHPPTLELSEFKDLKRALDLPGSTIVSTRNSPLGVLQIVEGPALRYAPGVSLTYGGDAPICPIVFKNGDWFGPIQSWNPALRDSILDYTTGAAAYALKVPERVLVLDAGTGAGVVQGLLHARTVTAVEPHPSAAEMLSRLSPGNKRLRVFSEGARAFLGRDRSSYDLIVLPMANTFGGSSGINALAENHLLTIEGVTQTWRHLDPDGMLCVSCWLDTPPRASLRLIATASAVLGRLGMDPARHIAAIQGWGTFTMLVKRSSITHADIEHIHGFCDRFAFDALIPIGQAGPGDHAYGPRQEGWSAIAAGLVSGRGQDMPYEFNIRPATDDKPYFSQFLTVRSLARLKAVYGGRAIPFFELGYLILILATVLVSLLAVVLILLPLVKAKPGRPLSTLLYFGGLGTGFLFLEIALIQHALMYLGAPIYAAAIAIGGLLFFSGCGSLASDAMRKAYRIVPACIAGVILIYALVLAPLISRTCAPAMTARVLIWLLAIAPLAFCLGMPFPMGIARLPQRDVPWAWGINGCLSVVSAPLANIIAVELGFTWLMILSGLAYAVAWLGRDVKRYA